MVWIMLEVSIIFTVGVFLIVLTFEAVRDLINNESDKEAKIRFEKLLKRFNDQFERK